MILHEGPTITLLHVDCVAQRISLFGGFAYHSLRLDLLILLGAKAKDIDKVGRDIMLSNTSDLKMSACSRPVLLSGTVELVLA